MISTGFGLQHFRIDCLDYKVEIVSSVEGS